MTLRSILALLTLASTAFSAEKKDPFAELVRPTEPLTPEQERAAFHLPPGFEIQLVAGEPDLRKPMNMQWDALGRLWITESREYPFPVKDGSPGRDTVRIFSDFAPDGRARKMEIFAEGLNIPTGLYPFRSKNADGKVTWKCVVWSIPNIWLMEDTDGDGKADKREALYGPLGWERDTHGNLSSFRRGVDGWLYGTHGFNNESTLRGRDGSELKIQSGNTYRIRLDGSRVEGWTFGQVNPFGLCWDNRGNLFSADCHSSPIYQLLRGAYYPSFGKPHDGLGFGPTTITHSHGSTAICAPMYVCDPAWPAEWQDHMFVCNVQTSRINHDAITWHGSSSKGAEMPDFLTTDDPWFRPVDLSWGPDGALYVADFYNRIIGHYEVPLTHPGRDRERGRIWRIVYRGEKGAADSRSESARRDADAPVRRKKSPVILSGAPSSASETARNEGSRGEHDGVKSTAIATDIPGLIREFASTNLTRRTLALNDLCDVHGTDALPAIKAALAAPTNAFQKLNALWALSRLGALDEATLTAAMHDADPLVRTHALRIVAQVPRAGTQASMPVRPAGILSAVSGNAGGTPAGRTGWKPAILVAARAALTDNDAFVQRCAADALAVHPAAENVAPLLMLLRTTAPGDDHLIHATRIALRDQLRDPAVLAGLSLDDQSAGDRALVLELLLAASGEASAEFRMKFFESHEDASGALFADHLPTLARNTSATKLESLFALAQRKLGNSPDELAAGLDALLSALDQRGIPPGATLRSWGPQVVAALLSTDETASTWTNSPAGGAPPSANPWGFEQRKCADGKTVAFMSSFPHGEKLTGTLRSPAFTLPPALSFFLCGHDDSPGKPAAKTNHVRLRDAQTSAVLREAAPPRSDTAQKIAWNLSDCAGRRAVIEVTDANTGSAYAWLAIARFEPQLPELKLAEPPNASRRVQTAADIIRTLKLTGFEPALTKVAFSSPMNADTRAAAARALLGTSAETMLPQIAAVLSDPAAPAPLREKFAAALAETKSPAAIAAIAAALRDAPHRLQPSFASALASSREGAEALLASCTGGRVPAMLLLNKALVDRLRAAKVPNLDARITALTANLPPANAVVDKLIAERRSAFNPARASAARGAGVFARNCAACHSIGGKGGVLGPQLDGIGGRGADRLLEDILDPNRNVDRAFRMNVITLKNGSVIGGLPRREEGAQLVLADAAGQETRVAMADIAERKETETSLMPPTFGEVIPPAELNDLLAFLLGKRPPK